MEFFALLVILGFAVALQNLLFSRCAFKKLRYRCALSCSEAVEGDEIELVETVENRGWLPAPWLKAEITTSRFLDFAGSQSVLTDRTRFVPSFFMVRGYQKIERRWKVTCLRRGVFSIEKVVLVSTDLFGNVSLSQPVDVDASVTVLPRPLRTRAALSAVRDLMGDFVVRRRLCEDPFYRAGAREYADGDPMNRISWTATARAGRLMVHENEYTSRRNLTVVLNMQSRPFENGEVLEVERMEDCIRVCAALFETALHSQMPLRFLTNASTASAGTPGWRTPVITAESWGEPFVHGLLRTLACLRLESTDDWPVFLGEIAQRASADEIVLVTCFFCEAMNRFAREQAARGGHVRVLLLGYLDADCPVPECEVACIRPGEGGDAR